MKKIQHLETMRGVACILLVFFHTVGSYSSNGLRLNDDDALRVFNNLLQDLRMPLFSFISGFVFLVVVDSFGDVLRACAKKARRLYIPMVTASVILFFLKDLTNGNGQPFQDLFFKSYEHLWYLQATLVMMFLQIFLVWLTRADGYIVAGFLWIVGSVAYVLFYDKLTDVMSINGACYLSPYFFAGYVTSEKYRAWAVVPAPAADNKRNWLSLAVAGVVLLVVQYPLKTDLFSFPEEAYRLIRIVMGLAVCSTFLVFRATSRWLTWLGSKSYPIYLYHTIFAAAVRQALLFVVPDLSAYYLVLPILLAGLTGPVFVEWLAMRWSLSALLVLGVHKRTARAGGLVVATT